MLLNRVIRSKMGLRLGLIRLRLDSDGFVCVILVVCAPSERKALGAI